MKLKIGDKIVEDDGICIIVYEIVDVTGDVATGHAEFEGKKYPILYKAKQKDPDNIELYKPFPGDLTTRKLIR